MFWNQDSNVRALLRILFEFLHLLKNSFLSSKYLILFIFGFLNNDFQSVTLQAYGIMDYLKYLAKPVTFTTIEIVT